METKIRTASTSKLTDVSADSCSLSALNFQLTLPPHCNNSLSVLNFQLTLPRTATAGDVCVSKCVIS
jgi:hypothetical protein